MAGQEGQPDTSQDPSEVDTGQGYPEEGPAGTSPQGDGRERGPEADVDDPPAPESDPGRDSPPSKATGNPPAAGP